MSASVCPECRSGACRNCTGWALDESTDDFTACRCGCAS